MLSVAVKELEKLHKKRLMVQFDNSDKEHDREIDITTREITNHFNSAKGKLREIAGNDSMDPYSTDVQVRRNIQRYAVGKRHQ